MCCGGRLSSRDEQGLHGPQGLVFSIGPFTGNVCPPLSKIASDFPACPPPPRDCGGWWPGGGAATAREVHGTLLGFLGEVFPFTLVSGHINGKWENEDVRHTRSQAARLVLPYVVGTF